MVATTGFPGSPRAARARARARGLSIRTALHCSRGRFPSSPAPPCAASLSGSRSTAPGGAWAGLIAAMRGAGGHVTSYVNRRRVTRVQPLGSRPGPTSAPPPPPAPWVLLTRLSDGPAGPRLPPRPGHAFLAGRVRLPGGGRRALRGDSAPGPVRPPPAGAGASPGGWAPGGHWPKARRPGTPPCPPRPPLAGTSGQALGRQ